MNAQRVLLILGIAFFIADASLCISQVDRFDEPWRWVHFTTESGLSSNELTSLTETADGTVWAATTAGIAWYDGYQWQPLRGIPLLRYSPLQAFGRNSIVFSAEGNVFVATRETTRVMPFSGTTLGAPLDDSSLIMRMDNNLFLYRNGKMSPMVGVPAQIRGKVDILWKTRTGNLWLGTLLGAYKWEDGSWNHKLRSLPLGTNVNSIVENEHRDGIVSVLLPLEMRGQWEWFNGGEPVKNSTELGYDIKSMDMGSNGDVVVIYNSGDVRIRRSGVWSSLTIVQTKLPDVEFVRWRSNGDLWFGTERGLYLFRQSSSRWTFLSHDSPDPRNKINEILRTRKGELWIGTADGIDIYRTNGRVDHISKVGNTTLFTITGLAEDADGGVWISSGAAFDGAFRWKDGVWKYFSVTKPPNSSRVHKIRNDHYGRLWFLTLSRRYGYRDSVESGAYLYSDGAFQQWGTEQGLLNGRVYGFCHTLDGAIWFGTLNGLSRWKPYSMSADPQAVYDPLKDGFWTHWSRNEGLHYNKIFTLTVDKTGKVWFAHSSTGGGVGYVDEHDSVHYFTTADGLLNNNVWDLDVDSSGVVWMATDAGLCSFSRGVWLTYDEKTGLNFPKLWPVLPVGDTIYVGTRGRGVAILNRNEGVLRYPRVVIDRPVVEDRTVHIRWKALAYWGDISPGEILTRFRFGDGQWSPWSVTREHVVVKYDPGEYVFQVQAKGLLGDYDTHGESAGFAVLPPLFLRPQFYLPVGVLAVGIILLGGVMLVRKRRHSAELRKSEAKFRAVAEMTPSAIFIYQYGNLLFANPGAETLTEYSGSELRSMTLVDLIHQEYRAMMEERELARTGETIVPNRAEFKIVTKQGKERWVDYRWGWIRFQGLPATLGTAFDISERKDAEDQLRLLTSELTLTEERERHRMATYLHDVIGQTLALCRIKIRGLQKSGNAGGTESALKEIQELVDQSINHTQSLTFELCPPILYELSFDAAVGWLIERFQQEHGLPIKFHGDNTQKPLTEEMRTILFQALREILVNVSKHARATSVDVIMRRNDNEIRIVVSDEGVGFDPASLIPDGKRQGGFGLFNIRERLRYLGGVLEIASVVGQGTRISITAPMQPSLSGVADTHRLSVRTQG